MADVGKLPTATDGELAALGRAVVRSLDRRLDHSDYMGERCVGATCELATMFLDQDALAMWLNLSQDPRVIKALKHPRKAEPRRRRVGRLELIEGGR